MLAVIVATLGVALVSYVPIEVLRFVVGFLLLRSCTNNTMGYIR